MFFFKNAPLSFHEFRNDRLLDSRNGARMSSYKLLGQPSIHEVHCDRLLGSRNEARSRF